MNQIKTLIFAIIFLAIGLVTYKYFTKPLAEESKASESWPTTEAYIENSDLFKTKGKENKTMYSADINYTYTVENIEYSGNNITTLDGSTSVKSSVVKTLKKYPKGSTTKAYYDPEFPESAVLEPGISFWFGILLKLPLIFCIVSVLMILGFIKRLFTR